MTRRILASLVFLFCCSSCLADGPPPQPPGTIRITLLQLNDVYQIAPIEKGTRGGLARVATLAKKIRATAPNVAFVLAGDTLSPSVASKIFKGAQMVAVFNAVGLDVAALGNHEFDMGDEVLRERIKESKFRWVTANAVLKKSGKPFDGVIPYHIRDMGGVKVGFLGLVTTETEHSSNAGDEVSFLDAIATAKKYVPMMRKEGAEMIVAVTHLTMAEDKALAAAVPIDVICGGHEHIVMESIVGTTPIYKVASDARNLGRIDLFYSKAQHRVQSIDFEMIPVTNLVPDDPQVAAIVATFEKRLDEELGKPVGRTAVELETRLEMSRTRETNVGNFITDAYRAQTKADVALTNGGSIRGNQLREAGVLTRKDVLAILPFESPIVKVEVKGAVLRKALEHGLARAGDLDNGAFPQVSGVKLKYDGRKPAGSRIVEVSVNGQPLDDNRTYTLAMSSFIANGGDGYVVFKDHVKYLIDPEEGQVEPAVIIGAIQAAGEIAPRVEGRVVRIDQ